MQCIKEVGTVQVNVKSKKDMPLGQRIKRLLKNWPLHLMILPCVILLAIFCYYPMSGVLMGFTRFNPNKGFFGSEWLGLYYFKRLFTGSDFPRVIWNSFYISMLKTWLGLVAALTFALLLNEMRLKRFKKVVHAVTMFPHFVSWVICANLFRDILYSDGALNQILLALGLIEEPIFFLGSKEFFVPMLVVTDLWKGFGYGSVLITAALTNIDPGLYEAAYIDGAGRWKQTLHVTLPGIASILAMIVILNISGVLSAGFDQIYNLYNQLVMDVADVIDTYVYRMGYGGGQYSLSTAAGLFKSIVGSAMLLLSWWLAEKYTDYRVF